MKGSFTLAIPATADHLDPLVLRMTAVNILDGSLKNSAVARMEIARDGDLDNDSVDDTRDNCRDVPNADQIDMNRNGVRDACDPALGRSITIRGLSPQSGPPGSLVKIVGSGLAPPGRTASCSTDGQSRQRLPAPTS